MVSPQGVAEVRFCTPMEVQSWWLRMQYLRMCHRCWSVWLVRLVCDASLGHPIALHESGALQSNGCEASLMVGSCDHTRCLFLFHFLMRCCGKHLQVDHGDMSMSHMPWSLLFFGNLLSPLLLGFTLCWQSCCGLHNLSEHPDPSVKTTVDMCLLH